MQRAYMSSACILNNEQVNYLKPLTSHWHRHTKALLYHIFSTSFAPSSDNTFIAFPWTLMERKCPNRDIDHLLELVERTGYSKEDHICREYKIMDHIMQELLTLSDPTNTYVNAMTGKPTKAKHQLVDDSNNPINSPLVIQMLKSLSPHPINTKAVDEEIAFHKHLLNSHIPHVSTTNLHRIQKDIYNLEGIKAFTKEGLFYPQYKMCSTGRVYQYNSGGFQNLRSELKAKVLQGTEYYNWDLKNAQPEILLDQFNINDINCPWLNNFLNADKSTYSQEINIPLKLWKKCFCSIIFGASFSPIKSLPDFLTKVNNNPDSVAATLSTELGIIESTYLTYQQLQEQLQHFTPAIKKYFRACQQKRVQITSIPHSGGYFRNALNLSTREKQGNKLAAHIIQGIEQLYINNLIILCHKAGIQTYAHEFDGLITNQSIPTNIISDTNLLVLSKGITSQFNLVLKPL